MVSRSVKKKALIAKKKMLAKKSVKKFVKKPQTKEVAKKKTVGKYPHAKASQVSEKPKTLVVKPSDYAIERKPATKGVKAVPPKYVPPAPPARIKPDQLFLTPQQKDHIDSAVKELLADDSELTLRKVMAGVWGMIENQQAAGV